MGREQDARSVHTPAASPRQKHVLASNTRSLPLPPNLGTLTPEQQARSGMPWSSETVIAPRRQYLSDFPKDTLFSNTFYYFIKIYALILLITVS